MLGEVKWTEKVPTASDVERLAQGLIAQGMPIAGRERPEVRYAAFVSQRPKSKPKTPSNVTVFDARDVLEALR